MLNLPELERRHYRDTYLSRVIVQVKFPPILRIATEMPAELQDELRDEYPEYEREFGASVQISEQGSESGPISVTHEFAKENRDWSIRAAPNEFSLVANRYTRWEEARERFRDAARSFWNIYEPAAVRRIGFLYQDIFEEVDEGSTAIWSEYFRDELVAPFTNEAFRSALKGGQQQMVLEHGDNEVRVAATARTGRTEDDRPVQRLDLDFDMYRNDTDLALGEAFDELETFHDTLIRLFEWAITDELRQRMDPEDAADE